MTEGDDVPPPLPEPPLVTSGAQPNCYWLVVTAALMAFALWGAIGRGEGVSIFVLWVVPSLVGLVLGLLIRFVWKRPYTGPAIALTTGCGLMFLALVGAAQADQEFNRFRDQQLARAQELATEFESLPDSDPIAVRSNRKWSAAVAQLRRIRPIRDECASLLTALTKPKLFLESLSDRKSSQFGAEKAFKEFAATPEMRDLRRSLAARLVELDANERRLDLLVRGMSQWSVSADGRITFSETADPDLVSEFDEAQAEFEAAQAAVLELADESRAGPR